jgi:iron(III) transport system ATP-binding protein
MLRTESIIFQRGKRLLLNNIAFAVEPGKCLAILGPSGSGKSTLLRILAGLIPPQNGKVLWQNTLLSENKNVLIPPEKRAFGMVFQNSALFPHLNVFHNVAFGLRRLPSAKQSEIVHEWLAKLNITHLATRGVTNLSGGEKQRVALARALAPQPRALLLDEPFSSVDRMARSELLALLKRVLPEAQTATVLVTHDSQDVAELADTMFQIDVV